MTQTLDNDHHLQGDRDLENLHKLHDACRKIRAQLAVSVVGQSAVVDQLLLCIFARGHCILEGVPGLAKTLMVSTLARCLSLEFSRIQFTPDLMPSDITGTEVIQEDRSTGKRELRFLHGPIFGNVVLTDEINRAPPKTQAALLEGMQERQVTAGGKRHPLHDPFFVLATQNPIEQEGTYRLPEAQLDRFLFKVFVDYPSPDEERQIYRLTSGSDSQPIQAVLNGPEILELQTLVRRVPVSDYVLDYALALVRATRGAAHGGPDYVARWVAWGAGPRAGQSLVLAAKAAAALQGQPTVSVADVRAVIHPVLRHRLVTTYTAQADGQTPDTIIERLLQHVPVRAGTEQADAYVTPILRS